MVHVDATVLKNAKQPGQSLPEDGARQLTERFGGVTAYARTPAAELWKPDPDRTTRDDIVYEVMTEALAPKTGGPTARASYNRAVSHD